MFERSAETIKEIDAVLVLNFDKETEEGIYKNYIGGATFLEMYDAFKKIKKYLCIMIFQKEYYTMR